MPTDETALVSINSGISRLTAIEMPLVIANSGPKVAELAAEFFINRLKCDNTRLAYGRALRRFLDHVHEQYGVDQVDQVRPLMVGGYLAQLQVSDPSKKQHLAAIRKFFNWLVAQQVLQSNPAQSVEGPSHSVSQGKTPHLEADQARELLEGIPLDNIAGYRDRALIAVMVYSFARISAAVAMDVGDFVTRNRHRKIILHEKGGKYHEVWAHHNAVTCVEDYLDQAGIREDLGGPLFRTLDRSRQLSSRRMSRQDAWAMVKRRCLVAGLPADICNHSFRVTGITSYMDNGGELKKAQQIANHSSARTTQLYVRNTDQPGLDEIERIKI